MDRQIRQSLQVGARRVYPRSDPREVEPIAWPNNAERGLNIHGLVQSRAQNMVGSENYGKMPSANAGSSRCRTMAAVDEKFSFLLSNFRTLLVDIAPYIAELELLFGDPQEMSLTHSGRIVTVTAKDLQQRFCTRRRSPKQTASGPHGDGNGKKEIVAEYLQAEAQLLPAGQFEQLGRIWHACRNALIEIDPNERMPENYIGRSQKRRRCRRRTSWARWDCRAWRCPGCLKCLEFQTLPDRIRCGLRCRGC